MDAAKIQLIVAAILPILFAITVHEAAHGWVADKRGDHTARMMGRLTLNPIKHIDPIGTVILPIFMMLTTGMMFGWAKPVPVISRNLKNVRFDMAWVALAGPASNLLMALIWAMIAKLAITFSVPAFIAMGKIGISVNLILGVLNLIPIPPLDGSRVISAFLPRRAAYYYDKIERFGFIILIAMLLLGFLNFILIPPVYGLEDIIFSVFDLPFN